ncbi:hypothetical protein AWC38_SpisGene10231 [Stylophora pistillata]|uniref:Uncharacterized protein n=1 Tax=Stylophora pistillata TaxID=50429 RepID=A0A2B4S8N3_STYPI|nr:hypothetical protein AWC38_SpisGene10231 [Stylophora pistillata]
MLKSFRRLQQRLPEAQSTTAVAAHNNLVANNAFIYNVAILHSPQLTKTRKDKSKLKDCEEYIKLLTDM